MTKQVSAFVLSATARSAIVSTFVDALNTAENTGSLVTQVCDVANKHTKGQPLSKPDQDAIISDIAHARGWKENVLKQRSNEVRTILKACGKLSEAVSLYAKRAKSCNWHTSMKLARRLNKGDSAQKAVAYALDKSNNATTVHPAGRAAGALKAWYKQSKADKRAVILKAVAVLQTIGLKLELA